MYPLFDSVNEDAGTPFLLSPLAAPELLNGIYGPIDLAYCFLFSSGVLARAPLDECLLLEYVSLTPRS